MDALLKAYFTWSNLVVEALVLWGIYWLLVVIRRRLRRGALFGRFQQPLTNFVSTFLLVYEPITILLLTLTFFLINPILHGAVLVLFLVAGFSRIRDYLSGRIILSTTLVAEGKRMKTPKASGVISRIGRIGLYLQTGNNLHFVNYSGLLTEGYSLATGREIGGYYQLKVTVDKEEGPKDGVRFLMNKFLTTPYLNRSFRPEVAYGDSGKGTINARVSVREDQHLRELLELMAEWGYPATVAKR